jgi:glycosyltransferase involved in cell wall biosynthesis
MSLSIIIPCKNEVEVIKTTVNKLLAHFLNKIQDFEIILINDLNRFKKIKCDITIDAI